MKKNALWMTMLLGSFAMSAPIEAGRDHDEEDMENNVKSGMAAGVAEGRGNVEKERQPQIDAIVAQLNAQTAKRDELIESEKKIAQVNLNLKDAIQKKTTDIANLKTEIENIKKEIERKKKEQEKKEQEEAANAARVNYNNNNSRRRY